MDNVVDILKSRGFIDAITNEKIREISTTSIKVYVGFDPTSDSLHLGHLVGVIALAWFQRYGHIPVAIVGGATGLVGDPSGKSHERPFLDKDAIKRNLDGIRENLKTVLDFNSSTNAAIILDNSEWFSQINCLDFLRDIGKQFRIGPMLSKESVKVRLNSQEGMSYTEFSYQLLQAYDFEYLFRNHNIVLQLGGSDQWGNITAGIELIRKLQSKEAYGITFPLITRSDGKNLEKVRKELFGYRPIDYRLMNFINILSDCRMQMYST